MDKCLVSVIMPAYNCEKFVALAINSILNQTYQNFELLIADDASTDRTREIIDACKDGRIKRFHNSFNQGYLRASNKLFKECKGDFITFQDADDYSDKDRLQKLSAALNSNPQIAVVGSNISKVDVNGKKFWDSDFPTDHDTILRNYLEHKVVFTGSALMLRRSVIDSIGIYNEYFNRLGSEDVYWYSLILEKFKVANLKDVLYFYRANPNSVASTFKNPKTKVLHNLCVRLFKERLKGHVDPIMNNDLELADKHCRCLLLIEEAKTNKPRAFSRGLLLFLFNWKLSKLYAKDFFYSLFKA